MHIWPFLKLHITGNAACGAACGASTHQDREGCEEPCNSSSAGAAAPQQYSASDDATGASSRHVSAADSEQEGSASHTSSEPARVLVSESEIGEAMLEATDIEPGIQRDMCSTACPNMPWRPTHRFCPHICTRLPKHTLITSEQACT
jgi:hypothetical protein